MDWARDYERGLPLPLYGSGRDPVACFEAFPRASLGELADNLGRGVSRCAWFWPDDGVLYAYADFEQAGDEHVWCDMEARVALPDRRKRLIRVAPATNYSDGRVFSVAYCPDCNRRCKQLVFTYRWTCQACSGLNYRSQRVGAKVARWERLDALGDLLGKGRPKGMHHTTFARLRAEFQTLKDELGSTRAEAPLEYRHSLRALWLKQPPSRRNDAEAERRGVDQDTSGLRRISTWLGPDFE